jgi:hypothetical protein
MKTALRFVLVLVAVFGIARVSSATPITYSISGTSSGFLGLSHFDGLVTVTMTGDTDNIVSDSFDDNGTIKTIYANPIDLTTVNIAGLHTASVLEPMAIYAFPGVTNVEPGEELFHLPLIVMGSLDDPPSLESFTGLAGTAGAGLAGYNLATSFGPFTGLGDVGYPVGLFLSTTGGNLTFDTNFVDGDESTFTATTRVPEPTSLSLLGCGILSLAGLSRLRKRV